jgi:hypothetical protein
MDGWLPSTALRQARARGYVARSCMTLFMKYSLCKTHSRSLAFFAGIMKIPNCHSLPRLAREEYNKTHTALGQYAGQAQPTHRLISEARLEHVRRAQHSQEPDCTTSSALVQHKSPGNQRSKYHRHKSHSDSQVPHQEAQ